MATSSPYASMLEKQPMRHVIARLASVGFFVNFQPSEPFLTWWCRASFDSVLYVAHLDSPRPRTGAEPTTAKHRGKRVTVARSPTSTS